MFDHITIEDDDNEWLPYLFWFIAEIKHNVGEIMALVSVEQADLDQLDADLKSGLAAVTARIDALSAVIPAGDLAALKADVAAVGALGTPPPVDTPPVV